MKQFKQSPINIIKEDVVKKDKLVKFNYHKQNFKIINNGINITLIPTADDCYIELRNAKIHLTEMHFHAPAEHQIDSNLFDMEVHLVHQEKSFNIVYGVLLSFEKSGFDFSKPFDNIDAEITIDLSVLINSDIAWQYYGSLTTEPFNENVIWIISKNILKVDECSCIKLSDYFPCNNRCIHKLNERIVYDINIANQLR